MYGADEQTPAGRADHARILQDAVGTDTVLSCWAGVVGDPGLSFYPHELGYVADGASYNVQDADYHFTKGNAGRLYAGGDLQVFVALPDVNRPVTVKLFYENQSMTIYFGKRTW